MTSFYIHFFWFLVLLVFSILILSVFFVCVWTCSSYFFEFNLFSFYQIDLSVSFLLNHHSSVFSSVILLVSSIVMVYSHFYMSPYSNVNYFLWATLLFVASMLLVVNMTNLFFIILGWDGLGLVSFFLIVYFQNSSSISSGVFTLLMNRIGDCFFLLSISLIFLTLPDTTFFYSDVPSLLVCGLLMVTFMTKSAIYPFSPWLPLAMAAPTPISALVHSSTLVTAGLFLMVRFSYFFYSSPQLCFVLLMFSVFTSFYAGLNCLFETDMKNLIALSTLSHLGFIGLAFSVGLSDLAFFHMLTHALFKSLLFMCMGDIMVNMGHSQDIRFLSSGSSLTPLSSFIMYSSLLNLLGLPMTSGFFSKDLILESLLFSSSSSLICFLVYLNLVFTYFYTYQLFYFSFSSVNSTPFMVHHSQSNLHTVLLILLGLAGLFFGHLFVSSLCIQLNSEVLPLVLNSWPVFANFLVFSFVCLFLNFPNFSRTSSVYTYFESMMFLQLFWSNLFSVFYFSSLFSLVKSFELGALNSILNVSSSSIVHRSSGLLLTFSMFSPLRVTLFLTFFVMLFVSISF